MSLNDKLFDDLLRDIASEVRAMRFTGAMNYRVNLMFTEGLGRALRELAENMPTLCHTPMAKELHQLADKLQNTGNI